MAKGILGGILAGGGHFLALKELVDIVTSFLDKTKDNPLVRAVIEKVARDLREEILTKEAIKLMGGYNGRRIEALQTHLRKTGNTGDLQALRNGVLTYIIFENAEIPLTQAPPPNKVTNGGNVFKLGEKLLSFTFAIEFLNDIASHIKRKGSGYDFQPALNRLKDYGFIGQMDKTFWMNVVGKSRVGIEGLFAKLTAGGPVMPKVKKFLAKEFPATLPPEGITQVLTEMHTGLRRFKRRLFSFGLLK